jgi:ankyrin repeat protein
VQLLLGLLGVDVDQTDRGGRTPLFVACQRGSVELCRLLLGYARPASLDERRQAGFLLFAADVRAEVKAQLAEALDAGARLTSQAVVRAITARWTALGEQDQDSTWAARADADEAGAAAYGGGESGIDVNQPSSTGATPLFAACQGGHTEIVRLLLERPSVAVNRATEFGATPLFVACEESHFECTELLLVRPDCAVNQLTREGVSALYVACEQGDEISVQLLLRRGAAVNQLCGGTDVTRLAFDVGGRGATPLMAAGAAGHARVCSALLARGALSSNEGRTAIELARDLGNDACVRALSEPHCALCGATARAGQETPLLMSDSHVDRGAETTATWLHQRQMEIWLCDVCGLTHWRSAEPLLSALEQYLPELHARMRAYLALQGGGFRLVGAAALRAAR